MVAFLDWMDKDNDGSMLDDGARLAAQGAGGLMGLAGAGLGGIGALTGGVGSALGGVAMAGGGALVGAGLAAETVPGLQIPGTTAIALGSGLLLGGGGLGAGSLALGAGMAGLGGLAGAGGALMGTFGADVAEEVGDFTADLFGTRGAQPVADQPIGDDFYRNGRTDGLGQQLNNWLFP